RRGFLQSAYLAIGGGYAHCVLGGTYSEEPKFAERPTFEPKALFLTWQLDPTTTMTVQWVGSGEDAAHRPIWYAKKGSQLWGKQGYSTRRFPKTAHRIHRAELTGLEPGAEYVFRVGTDSAEHRFRTMPAKN